MSPPGRRRGWIEETELWVADDCTVEVRYAGARQTSCEGHSEGKAVRPAWMRHFACCRGKYLPNEAKTRPSARREDNAGWFEVKQGPHSGVAHSAPAWLGPTCGALRCGTGPLGPGTERLRLPISAFSSITSAARSEGRSGPTCDEYQSSAQHGTASTVEHAYDLRHPNAYT